MTQQDLDNALAPIHAQLANTTAQLAKAEQHIARIEWKMSIVSLQVSCFLPSFLPLVAEPPSPETERQPHVQARHTRLPHHANPQCSGSCFASSDCSLFSLPRACLLIAFQGLAQVTSSSEVDALLGPDLDAWLEFYGLVAPPSVLDKRALLLDFFAPASELERYFPVAPSACCLLLPLLPSPVFAILVPRKLVYSPFSSAPDDSKS